MESTGKYWIPIYNTLESTCQIVLAHPKYVKAIRGKKTDEKDAKWIADIFKHGFRAADRNRGRLKNRSFRRIALCYHAVEAASDLNCFWGLCRDGKVYCLRVFSADPDFWSVYPVGKHNRILLRDIWRSWNVADVDNRSEVGCVERTDYTPGSGDIYGNGARVHICNHKIFGAAESVLPGENYLNPAESLLYLFGLHAGYIEPYRQRREQGYDCQESLAFIYRVCLIFLVHRCPPWKPSSSSKKYSSCPL